MSCVLKSLTLTASLQAEIKEMIGLGHSISTLVLGAVKEFPSARVAVPESLRVESLSSFRFGGICKLADSRRLLGEVVGEYLKRAPGNAAIFEDYLARPDDEFLKSASVTWARHDDEVYYLLSRPGISQQVIDQTLRRAFDPVHTLGLLTKLDERSRRSGVLTLDDLRGAVGQAESLIVGVFDSESFIDIPLQLERQ